MTGNGRGKYLYCVIGAAQPMEFYFAGVNGAGERVYSIHVGDLAAVAGDSAANNYRLSLSTAMAHQLVIQEVMQKFTVLPFSFGAVAGSEEEVRELLTRYRGEFLAQLRYLEGKAEYCLKALWRDKEQPFREILAQREDIRRYRDAIAQRPPTHTHHERIELGRMVQEALLAKKEAESQHLLEHLRPLAVEVRVNNPLMDHMLLNAALLLAKGSEPAFEEALQGLDREYEERVRLRLAGPSPPFNFVHLPLTGGG